MAGRTKEEFDEAWQRTRWKRKQGQQQELVRCDRRRCWNMRQKSRGPKQRRAVGRAPGLKAMHPALTWTTRAAPLLLLHRSRFHRDRVTVSFLDRATSSSGTRTFCPASHIAYTVRGEGDQRHKFQLILEGRKILTGKYYPDDRRVKGDTVSSAGGKRYKPI